MVGNNDCIFVDGEKLENCEGRFRYWEEPLRNWNGDRKIVWIGLYGQNFETDWRCIYNKDNQRTPVYALLVYAYDWEEVDEEKIKKYIGDWRGTGWCKPAYEKFFLEGRT